MNRFNYFLGKAIQYFGYDLRRYPNGEDLLVKNEFTSKNINTVFDVGANVGQYVSYLRNILGYKNLIVSFEPLLGEYKILLEKSKNDKNWQIVNVACGSQNEFVKINRAANSQSSSILQMLDKHLDAAPNSKFISKEEIEVVRLDDIYKKYCSEMDNVFLKIDVQGYEMHVLEGGSKFLPNCKGIQLELSLKPLYENEKLYFEMIHTVENLGFHLHTIYPGFRDERNNELLQIDAIFFR